MERHLFLCCLYFFQFSDVRNLLNSFRSLNLTIISFLSSLVMKGLLLYRTFFVYKERIYPKWIERFQEMLKSIDQLNFFFHFFIKLVLFKVFKTPMVNCFRFSFGKGFPSRMNIPFYSDLIVQFHRCLIS